MPTPRTLLRTALAAVLIAVLAVTGATVLPGQPATAAIPVEIMAVGDSVTEGANSTDGMGYRSMLANRLRDIGYAPTLVDASENGRRVDTIRPIVDAALAANGVPDVSLWLLGTNDWQNPALWNLWYQRYYDEIARVLAMSPTTKAVVATVPLLPGHTGVFVNLNAWITDITAVWLARDFPGRVRVCDLASVPQVFVAGPPGGGDTIHPGDAGYSLIADLWLECLRRSPSWLP